MTDQCPRCHQTAPYLHDVDTFEQLGWYLNITTCSNCGQVLSMDCFICEGTGQLIDDATCGICQGTGTIWVAGEGYDD